MKLKLTTYNAYNASCILKADSRIPTGVASRKIRATNTKPKSVTDPFTLTHDRQGSSDLKIRSTLRNSVTYSTSLEVN